MPLAYAASSGCLHKAPYVRNKRPVTIVRSVA